MVSKYCELERLTTDRVSALYEAFVEHNTPDDWIYRYAIKLGCGTSKLPANRSVDWPEVKKGLIRWLSDDNFNDHGEQVSSLEDCRTKP